jgi:hypothetical protein
LTCKQAIFRHAWVRRWVRGREIEQAVKSGNAEEVQHLLQQPALFRDALVGFYQGIARVPLDGDKETDQ